ncbi:hypothetical protein HMPREF9123_0174 [Neisseria bacilliformis ATCC BAA-1200]|uniref:Uncharacterized protein n=1 Tax=Neisseria bacilliformis ATCC BAA-1200 TaxID=888742 RepID=F2B8S4_9NEIS|nr:hypothetical protein HMPREF9123_0174 [Neisseria bacilliformis ATCC BAA-1200]
MAQLRHPERPELPRLRRLNACNKRQRPSENCFFQTAFSHPTHTEPNVGCAAPRRRTRFLPPTKSVPAPPSETACVAAPHTLPKGRGRLKNSRSGIHARHG